MDKVIKRLMYVISALLVLIIALAIVLIVTKVSESRQLSITLGATDHGTIEVNKTVVDKGGKVKITFTPDLGYELDYFNINGETQDKPSSNEVTYSNITSNITIGAWFKLSDYTVTFISEGTILYTLKAHYGDIPVYVGSTPTKETTQGQVYKFVSWSPTISSITGDTTYNAVFSSSTASYDVSWVVNGIIVKTDTKVPYGTTPTYDGATPTKPSTQGYDYTFAGWEPQVSAVTGHVTYNAVFTSVAKVFSITFLNYDGSLIAVLEVPYGTLPTITDPTREATVSTSYTFAGWSPSLEEVSADATYTATYTQSVRKYSITWKNADASIIAVKQVPYNTLPTITDPTLPSTAEFDYTFVGWYPSVVVATEDATYTATYTQTTRSYTILWVVNGTTVETDNNVLYGTTPSYDGATPTKDADNTYSYTFASWTPDVTTVSADATYTASFTPSYINYSVTFYENGGTPEVTDLVLHYGDKVPSPVGITLPEHTLEGWYSDSELTVRWNFTTDTITTDLNLYAKWVEGQSELTATYTFVSGNGTTALKEEDSNLDKFVGTTADLDLLSSISNLTNAYIGTGDLTGTDWWTVLPGYINENGKDKIPNVLKLGKSSAPSNGSITINFTTNISLISVSILVAPWNAETSPITVNGVPSQTLVKSTVSTVVIPVSGNSLTIESVKRDIIYGITITYAEVNPSVKYSLVVTAGENGSVSGHENGLYNENAPISLDAIPYPGYLFSGWYNGDTLVSSENPYSFNINSNVTLEARFELNSEAVYYDLVVTSGLNGTIGGHESGNYVEGTLITLSATPSVGYALSGWYSDTTLVSSANPYSFTLESDVTLEARFIALEQFLLTINVGSSGSLDVTSHTSGTYYSGTSITIKVNPNPNFIFTGWYNQSAGGDLISSSNPYTFVLESATTLYARYEEGIEYNYNHTFTTAGQLGVSTGGGADAVSAAGSATLSGLEWSWGAGKYRGFDATKGIQLGSGNSPQTSPLTFTITLPAGAIVYAYMMELSVAVDGSMTYQVNAGTYNSGAQTVTSSSVIQVKASGFEETTSSFIITFTSNVAKAMYFKSIHIKYTLGVVYDVNFVIDGTPNVQHVVSGDNAVVPSTSKTGYTFVGWFTEENGLGSEVTSFDNITSALTVYAYYTINSYQVTWKTDTDEEIDTTSVQYLNTPTHSNPTKTSTAQYDYTFAGWSDILGGSVLTSLPSVTSDVTYYAIFSSTIREYTLTFNTNGGNVISSVTVPYGTELYSIKPADPTKEGYFFSLWYYDDVTFLNTVLWSGVYLTSDLTIYVKWSDVDPELKTVTLVFNNGLPNQEISVSLSEAFYKSSDPLRNGYTFVGWYTDPELITPVTWVSDDPDYLVVTDDITLYAKWSIVTYSISYYDGSSLLSLLSSTYDITSSTITLPIPTKAGFEFVSWKDNALLTGSAITTIETGSYGDKVYYAEWLEYFSVSFVTWVSGYTISSIQVLQGNNAELPEADGNKIDLAKYGLLGWFLTESGDPQTGWEAYASASFTGSISEDITLYAVWGIYSGGTGSSNIALTFLHETFPAGSTYFLDQTDITSYLGLSDSPITAIVTKGQGNGVKFPNANGVIRLYAHRQSGIGGTITFTSTSTINYITATFSNPVIQVLVNDTIVNITDGKYIINANSFIIRNTYYNTATGADSVSGDITALTINYATSGGTPTLGAFSFTPSVIPALGDQLTDVDENLTVSNGVSEIPPFSSILWASNHLEYFGIDGVINGRPTSGIVNVDFEALIQVNGVYSSFQQTVTIKSIHTVVWKGYDGSTLETDVNQKYGWTAAYGASGNTVVPRESDSSYSYTFVGWSTNIDALPEEALLESALPTISADVTYYAIYSKVALITVDFVTNYTGWENFSVVVALGDSVSLPTLNAIVDTELYGLFGWYLSATELPLSYQSSSYVFSSSVSENITLYAVWGYYVESAPSGRHNAPATPVTVTAQYTGDSPTNMVDGANNASLVNLDPSIFNVNGTQNGGVSNNVGLTASDHTIRLYTSRSNAAQGNTLTFTINPLYYISSITINFGAGSNTPANANLIINVGTEVYNGVGLASTAKTYNSLHTSSFYLRSFDDTNTGSSNTQIHITSIVITYQEVVTETPKVLTVLTLLPTIGYNGGDTSEYVTSNVTLNSNLPAVLDVLPPFASVVWTSRDTTYVSNSGVIISKHLTETVDITMDVVVTINGIEVNYSYTFTLLPSTPAWDLIEDNFESEHTSDSVVFGLVEYPDIKTYTYTTYPNSSTYTLVGIADASVSNAAYLLLLDEDGWNVEGSSATKVIGSFEYTVTLSISSLLPQITLSYAPHIVIINSFVSDSSNSSSNIHISVGFSLGTEITINNITIPEDILLQGEGAVLVYLNSLYTLALGGDADALLTIGNDIVIVYRDSSNNILTGYSGTNSPINGVKNKYWDGYLNSSSVFPSSEVSALGSLFGQTLGTSLYYSTAFNLHYEDYQTLDTIYIDLYVIVDGVLYSQTVSYNLTSYVRNITWDIEGETTVETYLVGETPSYKGSEPVKDGYVFYGFTPAFSVVTSDVTYYANFREEELVDTFVGDGSGYGTTTPTENGVILHNVQDDPSESYYGPFSDFGSTSKVTPLNGNNQVNISFGANVSEMVVGDFFVFTISLNNASGDYTTEVLLGVYKNAANSYKIAILQGVTYVLATEIENILSRSTATLNSSDSIINIEYTLNLSSPTAVSAELNVGGEILSYEPYMSNGEATSLRVLWLVSSSLPNIEVVNLSLDFEIVMAYIQNDAELNAALSAKAPVLNLKPSYVYSPLSLYVDWQIVIYGNGSTFYLTNVLSNNSYSIFLRDVYIYDLTIIAAPSPSLSHLPGGISYLEAKSVVKLSNMQEDFSNSGYEAVFENVKIYGGFHGLIVNGYTVSLTDCEIESSKGVSLYISGGSLVYLVNSSIYSSTWGSVAFAYSETSSVAYSVPNTLYIDENSTVEGYIYDERVLEYHKESFNTVNIEEGASAINAPYYSVTLYLNGGTLSTQNPYYTYGGSYANPGTPVSGSSIFNGWYESSTFDTDPVSFPLTVSANVSLYAKFTPVSDEDVANVVIQAIEELKELSLKYSDKAAVEGVVALYDALTQTQKDLVSNYNDLVSLVAQIVVLGNVVVDIEITTNPTKLTYYTNETTVDLDGIVLTFIEQDGDRVVTPYSSLSSYSLDFVNSRIVLVYNNIEVYVPITSVVPTVYYTVAFVDNYKGVSDPATQSVEEGLLAVSPSLSAYDTETYNLIGWYTESTLENLYDFSSEVEGNLTLYAAWEIIDDATYTLSGTVMNNVITSDKIVGVTYNISNINTYLYTVTLEGGDYYLYNAAVNKYLNSTGSGNTNVALGNKTSGQWGFDSGHFTSLTRSGYSLAYQILDDTSSNKFGKYNTNNAIAGLKYTFPTIVLYEAGVFTVVNTIVSGKTYILGYNLVVNVTGTSNPTDINPKITYTPGDSASSVKHDITLSNVDVPFVDITWSSDTPSIISTTGVLSLPVTSAQTVVLSATWSINGVVQAPYSVSLTVPATTYAVNFVYNESNHIQNIAYGNDALEPSSSEKQYVWYTNSEHTTLYEGDFVNITSDLVVYGLVYNLFYFLFDASELTSAGITPDINSISIHYYGSTLTSGNANSGKDNTVSMVNVSGSIWRFNVPYGDESKIEGFELIFLEGSASKVSYWLTGSAALEQHITIHFVNIWVTLPGENSVWAAYTGSSILETKLLGFSETVMDSWDNITSTYFVLYGSSNEYLGKIWVGNHPSNPTGLSKLIPSNVNGVSVVYVSVEFIQNATVNWSSTPYSSYSSLESTNSIVTVSWVSDVDATHKTCAINIGVLVSVYFDINYSEGVSPATQTAVNSLTITKPSDPERQNFSFLGWFIVGGALFNEWSTPISEDLYLEAHWESNINSYTDILTVSKITSPTNSTYGPLVTTAMQGVFSGKTNNEFRTNDTAGNQIIYTAKAGFYISTVDVVATSGASSVRTIKINDYTVWSGSINGTTSTQFTNSLTSLTTITLVASDTAIYVSITVVCIEIILTPAERVAADKLSITPPASPAIANFVLPILGTKGSTISWASNNAAIAIAGANATVTRPESVNANVTLTATISYSGVSDTREFTVIVTALSGVTTKTITINVSNWSSLNGTYDGGAVRTTTIDGIEIGGKAVMLSTTKIQAQKSNAVIYNKTSLGRIKSVTVTSATDYQPFNIYLNNSVCVNSTNGNYNVSSSVSKSFSAAEINTWGIESDSTVTSNYGYFCYKNGTSAAAYLISIVVVYEN